MLQAYSGFSGDPIHFEKFTATFDVENHDGWTYFPIDQARFSLDCESLLEALLLSLMGGHHLYGICEGSVFGEDSDILYPIFTNEQEQEWSILYREDPSVSPEEVDCFPGDRVETDFSCLKEALDSITSNLREEFEDGAIYLLMNGEPVHTLYTAAPILEEMVGEL